MSLFCPRFDHAFAHMSKWQGECQLFVSLRVYIFYILPLFAQKVKTARPIEIVIFLTRPNLQRKTGGPLHNRCAFGNKLILNKEFFEGYI